MCLKMQKTQKQKKGKGKKVHTLLSMWNSQEEQLKIQRDINQQIFFVFQLQTIQNVSLIHTQIINKQPKQTQLEYKNEHN